jgi:hypothetical protein
MAYADYCSDEERAELPYEREDFHDDQVEFENRQVGLDDETDGYNPDPEPEEDLQEIEEDY